MELNGVLFFPISPFSDDGLNVHLLDTHIRRGLDHHPGGVFVACGTGEMHALSPEEYDAAVNVAVGATARAVPVCAGAGGALPVAIAQVARAEAAGADAILLLPPYLVAGPGSGVVEYVRRVATSTRLPVIVYQRGQVRFTPETAVAVAQLPNVVGFKDGLGDMELMQQIVLSVRQHVGEDFLFFNGMPTAELTVPAYRALGVSHYSSAVFCFAPEVATAFHAAVQAGDEKLVELLLSEFYAPLVTLRNKVPGYAVSLVKAGVRLTGLPVGGVRPPLTDPTEDEVAQLHALVEHGQGLVEHR